jgi:hypothetical protein
MGSLPLLQYQWHTARPVKDHSFNNGAERPARGVGPRGPTLAASPHPRLVRHARAPPVPRHVQGRRPRSANTEACLARSTACAGGRPRWWSSSCAQRGRTLTQEPCGSTLRSLARREESLQRGSGRPSSPALGGRATSQQEGTLSGTPASPQGTSRSGTTAYMQERKRLTEPPHEGEGGWQEPVARAERSGAGAFLLEPPGGR